MPRGRVGQKTMLAAAVQWSSLDEIISLIAGRRRTGS